MAYDFLVDTDRGYDDAGAGNFIALDEHCPVVKNAALVEYGLQKFALDLGVQYHGFFQQMF